MSDGKSVSLAAKLITGAAVCLLLAIGLCFGGLVFSHGSNAIIGDALGGGLGLLALAVVLAVAAFIVYLMGLRQGPR